MLSRIQLSEIVAGGIILGEISPAAVRADSLTEPYPNLIRLFHKKKKMPSQEEILEAIGPTAYETATLAATRSKRLPMNWPTLLEKAAIRFETGKSLQKIANRLIDGEDVDAGPVHSALARLDKGLRLVTPLSKVSADEDPFIPSGYAPIDDYIGGLPRAGLTVIGGRPGVGKTWLLLKLAEEFIREHDGFALIFSLEMTAQQFAFRAKEKISSKKILDRILICDDILSVQEVSALASRTEGASFIGVDFAELLLEGDSMQTEQTMANIYRTLTWTARRQQIPVVLLSQLNRSGDTKVPTLSRLRYTGMAEALAALVMLLMNPSAIYEGDVDESMKKFLAPDRACIVGAKSRFGFRAGGPGIIQVEWNGKGWGEEVFNWFPLNGER